MHFTLEFNKACILANKEGWVAPKAQNNGELGRVVCTFMDNCHRGLDCTFRHSRRFIDECKRKCGSSATTEPNPAPAAPETPWRPAAPVRASNENPYDNFDRTYPWPTERAYWEYELKAILEATRLALPIDGSERCNMLQKMLASFNRMVNGYLSELPRHVDASNRAMMRVNLALFKRWIDTWLGDFATEALPTNDLDGWNTLTHQTPSPFPST